MSAKANKALLQDIFAGTARGDVQPLIDALADDASWTMMGTTPWSGTYAGKDTILNVLLAPAMEQFDESGSIKPVRFVAEDDVVVVEARNHSKTKTGVPYPNTYCWIYTLADGKIKQIIEYQDTKLVCDLLTRAE